MSDILDAELVAIIGGLVILVNRLVEGFITPIFDKFGWDKFWLLYIAWVLAGIIVFLTGLNLFADLIPNPLIGQIFTAVIAGGGANITHNILDK